MKSREEPETALETAAAIASTWRAIDAALSPIMGRGGVAALYKRSLRLVHAEHPWIASAHGKAQASLDLAALETALGGQSAETATAGGTALLQAFCSLLTGLVGPSLTEKVLGFACSGVADRDPAKEISG